MINWKVGKLLALFLLTGAAACLAGQLHAVAGSAALPPATRLPDLASSPKDLQTPAAVADKPTAGRRIRQVTPGYESTGLYHTLYLPTNWQTNHSYPVLVEYAGNGNYTNSYGDTCSGTADGCNLGYGISGGSNYIWVCLPFVQTLAGRKQNSLLWWGDVGQTIAYCTNTLRFLVQEFGADDKAMILTGFSRGAIACNYIGLHDEAIAWVWRAFIPCSHYDGLRTNWPYAGADRASASTRLARLRGRPQFISQEGSTQATETYLRSTGAEAPFTFVDIPFRNHSDQWVLRDCSARRAVRQWLRTLGLP